MRIVIVFDQQARALRRPVAAELVAQSHELVDLGIASGTYAEAAVRVAEVILAGGADRAILATSSALGASFLANKIDGIHAGVCTDTYDARRGGENGMNLMCLGTDLTANEAAAIVRAFVEARVDVRATLARAVSQPRAVVAA
jgi:ribose 5-phosphate isomerase B